MSDILDCTFIANLPRWILHGPRCARSAAAH
jgi:hypothetical protein